MLAPYFRFQAKWVADQTLTYNNAARVEVNTILWKMSSGARVVKAEDTDDFGFIAAGTWATTVIKETTRIDNSSDLYIGGNGTLEVIADVDSTDGSMYLYLEESMDDTIWPSDGSDFDIDLHCKLVCVLTLSTTAVDQSAYKNFEI